MNNMPKPRVIYLRKNFATNSSSSHSVLLFKEDVKNFISDIDADQEDGRFGWADFCLASKEAKISYLKSQIVNSWRNKTQLPKDKFGTDRYVDHQSNWGLFVVPNETGTDVHPKWFSMMENWISNDRLVIYGGNDNDGVQLTPPPNLKQEKDSTMPSHTIKGQIIGSFFERDPKYNETNQIIGRHVEDGDFFILFNKTNGAKVKLKYTEGTAPSDSPFPELVDMKITGYCPFACEYCYQDSTEKGKHASLEVIKKIIDILSATHVFEVAIGGGEPTLHPDFEEVLKYCYEKDIVPNFTSKNYALVKNQQLVSAIEQYCGAFAFSVDCMENIETIKKHLESNNVSKEFKNKIVIQHPVGSCSVQELKQIYANTPSVSNVITFLGHKETGRGNKSLVKASNKDVLKTIRFQNMKSNGPRPSVNIDTTFAKELETEIKTILGKNVFDKTMSTKDGVTSAYVDCVAETISASSYEPERGSFDIKTAYNNKERFKELWTAIKNS